MDDRFFGRAERSAQHSEVVKKLEYASWELRSYIATRPQVPWMVRKLLFESKARGLAMFGCEVWIEGEGRITELNKSESRVLRQLFQVARRPATAALHWLLQTLPLEVYGRWKCLCFAARLLRSGGEWELFAVQQLQHWYSCRRVAGGTQ